MDRPRLRAALAALALSAVCAGRGPAQPANDSCATPEPIAGLGDVSFDTALATGAPLAVACAPADIAADIWFCWTATLTGPVVLQLCGDAAFDSVLAAYSGCACPAPGSEIACNNDSCALQSRLFFLARAGQTYLVRLGGSGAAERGPGTLHIQSGIIHSDTYNGHTYHLYDASSWTVAQATAVALGGHLVSITDQAENDFIRFAMLAFDGRYRRTWLGLNDAASEGLFVWTSGEPVTFTNWNPGEPNNFGNEDYVEMDGGNGRWNDQPDNGAGFVSLGTAEIGGPPPCPADVNHDGLVNSQDFFDFLTAFFAAAPGADFNHDGLINSQDFFDFLTAFIAGC